VRGKAEPFGSSNLPVSANYLDTSYSKSWRIEVVLSRVPNGEGLGHPLSVAFPANATIFACFEFDSGGPFTSWLTEVSPE
jgi:hypothetical protein